MEESDCGRTLHGQLFLRVPIGMGTGIRTESLWNGQASLSSGRSGERCLIFMRSGAQCFYAYCNFFISDLLHFEQQHSLDFWIVSQHCVFAANKTERRKCNDTSSRYQMPVLRLTRHWGRLAARRGPGHFQISWIAGKSAEVPDLPQLWGCVIPMRSRTTSFS